MTMPETPAALWLRHVLDDEVEPLYQELRTERGAAVPTHFFSAVGPGAFPFILLFVALYAIACVLLPLLNCRVCGDRSAPLNFIGGKFARSPIHPLYIGPII